VTVPSCYDQPNPMRACCYRTPSHSYLNGVVSDREAPEVAVRTGT
jgi:hypothetical protein